MRLISTIVGVVTLCQIAAFGFAPPEGPRIVVSVRDQNNQPSSQVHIQVRDDSHILNSVDTDENGHAELSDFGAAHVRITASKDGFETVSSEVDLLPNAPVTVDFLLIPALVHKDSVDVHADAPGVEEAPGAGSSLPPKIAQELPGRPATVADALPLLPGVARTPGGGLQISGGGEHHSAMIVNSADVTDPATGQFGLTVPIDSVQSVNVYQTPFLAEYGRFTAGLVSVETRRGGDKWNWELNDPFPDFIIRSYHLRGVRDATPRLNFEGPLIRNKLYFSEGFEYEIRKTQVFTLPFPYNQKKNEGINSFAQLDWVVSGRQLVTATVHAAPQRMQFVNINYFNPEPTSPDAGTQNYTATLADRLSLGGGIWENTLSATRFDARVWPKGSLDLTMAPWGNTGNYFAQQDRVASRAGWSSTYSFAPQTWLGTHQFKVGSYIAESSDDGQVTERPVDIVNGYGQMTERISFTGGQPFRVSDQEYTFFGQDHWILSSHLSADLGIRADSQEISESFRVAPRVGIAWNPFSTAGTVIRAGYGLFYDRVPLNLYSFSSFPNQVITQFDPSGQIAAGPFVYQNILGQVGTRYPWVFQEAQAGNFSPRSDIWSVQVEQPLSSSLRLRVGYLENRSAGLVVLDSVPPASATGYGAYVLSASGQSRYHQFEVTARVRLKESSRLFFSYVRSRARGDLNDFANYLGSFPAPIIRPNVYGTLPTDLPNRFLAWGVVQFPHGIRISPVFEYRSGFPYAVYDPAQNYVGIPNQTRFPNFFSIDSRFSKDIKVNPKYSIRLSISGFNLTDHFNPEALHTNTGDPAFGSYFGQRGRHFTADFDVIF
jgi:hypothetical protein